MSLPYYNRDGEEISNDEWMRLFEDKEYKIVKQQTIHDYRVSTVWLGTDHSFGGGPVVLFETLVFGDDGLWDGYQLRWHTEAEALIGHHTICDSIAWWHTRQIGVHEWVRVRDPINPLPVDEAHT